MPSTVRGSGSRPSVNVSAVIDVEDVHRAAGLIYPVHDPVCAAARTATAREGPEERLAHSLRVDRERGFAELKHRGGNGLGKPLADSAAGGGL